MKQRSTFFWITRGLFFAVLVFLVIFPQMGFRPYIYRIGMLCIIYAILAISLNLLSGIAGQISLGHIAYYGIGAYTSALFALHFGFPHWFLLILTFFVSAFAGLIIGMASLRLSGGYLAITTLGFAEIIRLIMLSWMDVTRGPLGLPNIPRPVYFGHVVRGSKDYFYLGLVLLVLCILLLYNLINSKFGRNLKALRDDEISAESVGINVFRHKVIACIISAGIAGIAGSLYSHYFIYLDPTGFVSGESTVVLSMVVLGGMGNMWGAIIAAAILISLPETLRTFAQYRMFVYGLILIIMMLGKTRDWRHVRNQVVRFIKNKKSFHAAEAGNQDR
jgi:branched-chain amino acid transport system permease protein